jgi:hypothetical protein
MPKAATKKETSKASAKRGKAEEPKKRKRKAKKDPDAPKNPMSAYLLFCEEWREKVKAANPDSSFGKLGFLRGREEGGRDLLVLSTRKQSIESRSLVLPCLLFFCLCLKQLDPSCVRYALVALSDCLHCRCILTRSLFLFLIINA